MHNTTATLLASYQAISAVYDNSFRSITVARESLKAKGDLTQGDRADIGLILKKTEVMLHDLEKEARKIRELYEKVICAIYAHESLTNGPEATPKSIKGELGLATPNAPRFVPKLPSQKKEPKAYTRLLQAMGVPNEMAATGVFHMHWPTLVEYVSEQKAKGVDIKAFEGLDETVLHSCTFRKHNAVHLEDHNTETKIFKLTITRSKHESKSPVSTVFTEVT